MEYFILTLLDYFFDLTSFYRLGQKYKNIFIRFLVQMKTLKFAYEIYWPLLFLDYFFRPWFANDKKIPLILEIPFWHKNTQNLGVQYLRILSDKVFKYVLFAYQLTWYFSKLFDRNQCISCRKWINEWMSILQLHTIWHINYQFQLFWIYRNDLYYLKGRYI